MRTLLGVLSVIIPVGLVTAAVVEPTMWPRGGEMFDVFRIVLGICGIALMLAFIHHALRSEAVPSDKRRLWVAVLVLANIFALPFYWLWYIKGSADSRSQPS